MSVLSVATRGRRRLSVTSTLLTNNLLPSLSFIELLVTQTQNSIQTPCTQRKLRFTGGSRG